MRLLDKVMFFVAFLVPLALLPQSIQIYAHGDAGGLSIYTWTGLTVANALWALYGYIHRDKIVFTANILITLLNFSIVFGILKYSI
jgi:MtN3 and saliva related transmembrane protein